MEIEVKGHSGCAIEIIKENDDLCILKSTDDKKYFSPLGAAGKKCNRLLMDVNTSI